MNAELPPFKNGEHNSKNVSTINRAVTPLIIIEIISANPDSEIPQRESARLVIMIT